MPTELGQVDIVVRVVTDSLDRSLAKARAQVQRFHDESTGSIQKFERGFSDGMQRAAASTDIMQSAMMRLRQAMVLMGLAFSVQKIVHMTSAWTDLQARLKMISGTTEGASAMMARLVDVANRTYQPIEQTVTAFADMNRSLKDLGMSTKIQLDFMAALNFAMTASSIKGDRAASVQNALTRAMAAGTLRGDQLNTVIERGGKVAELIADQMHKRVSDLRALGQAGKITADVIQKALVGNLEALGKLVDEMPATLEDAFLVRMPNAVMSFVGTVDTAFGGTTMLAAEIVKLSDIITASAQPAINLISGTISVLNETMEDFGLKTQLARDVAETFFGTILGVLALKAVASLAFLVGRTLVGAFNLLTLTMLRNPLGLFVTAVVAAGIVIYKFRNEINKYFGVDIMQVMKDFANSVIRGLLMAREAIKLFISDMSTMPSVSALFAKMGHSAAEYFINDFVKEINNATRMLTKLGLPHGNLIPEVKLDPSAAEKDPQALKNLEEYRKAIELIKATNFADWISDAVSKTNELGDATGNAKDEAEKLVHQLEKEVKAVADMTYQTDSMFMNPEQKAIADAVHNVYDDEWQKHMDSATAKAAKMLYIYQQQKASMDAMKGMQFNQATMFFSPSEKAAADAMHSVFDDDWQRHMHDATANMARFNTELEQAYGMTRDFAGTFVHGMMDGKTAIEAVSDALKNLENKLIDMALDAVIQGLFKMLLSGMGANAGTAGGLFTTLFAGGGVGKYSSGGRVGSTGVPLWKGGRLAHDEYPAILHAGESVIPASVSGRRRRSHMSGRQMRRMFGGVPMFEGGWNAAAAAAGAYTAGDTGAHGVWSDTSGGGGNATMATWQHSQYTDPGRGSSETGSHSSGSGGGDRGVPLPRIRPYTPKPDGPVTVPGGPVKVPGGVFGPSTYSPTWTYVNPYVPPGGLPSTGWPNTGVGWPGAGDPGDPSFGWTIVIPDWRHPDVHWPSAPGGGNEPPVGNTNPNDPVYPTRHPYSPPPGRFDDPSYFDPPHSPPPPGRFNDTNYFHGGGWVGSTGVPRRLFSSSLFARAPRLHGGLGRDEYPAILQRGEQVIPRGGSGRTGVVVNIINNANASVSTETKEDNSGVRLDIVVDQLVASKMRDGGSRISRAMSSMGASPQPIRR